MDDALNSGSLYPPCVVDDLERMFVDVDPWRALMMFHVYFSCGAFLILMKIVMLDELVDVVHNLGACGLELAHLGVHWSVRHMMFSMMILMCFGPPLVTPC